MLSSAAAAHCTPDRHACHANAPRVGRFSIGVFQMKGCTPMTNRRNTQSNVQSLARWALPLVATTLVACGGGEEELAPVVIPGPSPVVVDAPLATLD